MEGACEGGEVRGGPGRGVSEEQGMGLGRGQRGIRKGPGDGAQGRHLPFAAHSKGVRSRCQI